MFKPRFIPLILVLLSLLLLSPALVAAEPMLPAAYWGTVKYSDGVPVPSGTVEAVVDGAVCGSIVFNNGFYGETGTGRKLVVQGNNLEPGKTVFFRVNTGGSLINAVESVSWDSGDYRQVNLTLQSAGPAGGSGANPGSGTTTSGGNNAVQGGDTTTPGSDTATPGNGTASPGGGSSDSNSGTATAGGGASTTNNDSTTSGGGNSTTSSGSTAGGGSSGATNSSSSTGSAASGGGAAQAGSTTPPANSGPARAPGSFSDVPSNHWACEEIRLMAERRIMVGVGGDSFAPEEKITRAQFAAMLVRAMGLSTDGAAVQFKDVPADQWYYPEVAAAFQNGLVSGYGPGEFGPDDTVTREQIAAILVRALIRSGKLQPVAAGEIDPVLAQFRDRADIGDWARESAAAAVKAGLVRGREAGTFAPQATATRAEGAALLKRFMQAAGLL